MNVPGIYVISGPHGVYVGQSKDCFARNETSTLLGLNWGIVREMPNATVGQLLAAEREVADFWAQRGWTIVSRNTTGQMSIAHRGRTLSDQHKSRLHGAWRGRKHTSESRAKMRASYHTVLSPEARVKISKALSGRKQPPEVTAKIATANRGKKKHPRRKQLI